MPIDPNISLAAGRGVGAAPEVPNALGMVGQFANIQNALNQNALFQQTFAARQIAGEIMAAAPDLETGLLQIQRNPATAAFAQQIASGVRQTQLTLTQLEGEQQKQAQSGLEGFMKSLPAIAADPSQWSSVVKANLATLSPTAQSRVAPAMESIRQGLTDGLPTDPAAARQIFNQRLGGLMIAGGVPPDSIRALSGALPPQVVQTTGPQGEPVTRVIGGPAIGTGIGGGGVESGGAVTGAGRVGTGIGPGGVVAAGPAEAQKSYFGDIGKTGAAYETELNNSVSAMQQQRRNISEIVDAAKEAQTGGGAGIRMKLGTALQALGVQNSVVDSWANGSLPASQVIDKLSLNNMTGQLRQAFQGMGGSRVNMQEFVAFLNKNPQLLTDPRAMVKIFNLWNDFYRRDFAEQQALNKAKDEPGFNMSKWPARWAASDYMQKFAPQWDISPEGIKGTGVPTRPEGAAPPVPSNQLTAPPQQQRLNSILGIQ